VPYTPILDIAPILKSTLDLIERTEYPHKGHPKIEGVRKCLLDAIEAIHELEALQAEYLEQSGRASSDGKLK
jgi:hypothetical protein